MEELITDIGYLEERYTQARSKYRPETVRVLLLAEAPPCALDRFFYFEDVKKQDSLFLETMGVLYPDLKKRYLARGRQTELKEELLETFKADGYWLLDLCGIPTSIVEGPSQKDVQSLLKILDREIEKSTPIILIKANVYDACYKELKAADYRVIDERMPFPGSGQQGVFRERFVAALQQCG